MARLRIRLNDAGFPKIAIVTLSRRNLLTLLHKLDMPGSARTIFNTDVEIDEEYTQLFAFVIHAEDDTEHYAKRPDPPGPMHPASETFVRKNGGWSPLGD